jgi:hypothetical protein
MVLSSPPDETADLRELLEAGASRGRFGYKPPTYYATPDYKGWDGVSEQEFIDALIQGLSPMFEVKTECWGTFYDLVNRTTHKVRVDLICSPLPGFEWPLGAFAVEAKKPTRGGNRYLGDHLKQAFHYTMTDWDGFGRLPVFLAPGIQGPGNGDIYYSARRVCGSFGIGEIFLQRHSNLASMYLTADPLMRDSRLTAIGAKRRKAGLGIASSTV